MPTFLRKYILLHNLAYTYITKCTKLTSYYSFFISPLRLHQKNSNTDVTTGYHMSYQHHYHHRPSTFHGNQKTSNSFFQNDYTPR